MNLIVYYILKLCLNLLVWDIFDSLFQLWMVNVWIHKQLSVLEWHCQWCHINCSFSWSFACRRWDSWLRFMFHCSLRMYNSLVERCFTDCVDTFKHKSLQKQEETCVRRCAEKFLKHSMRVGMRFAELNQGAATQDWYLLTYLNGKLFIIIMHALLLHFWSWEMRYCREY